MSDEQQEIISRPPSHPIATTLLVCAMLGMITCITIVSMELFTEYLPTPAQGVTVDPIHNSMNVTKLHRHNHYEADFKKLDQEQLLTQIEKEELKITSSIGGDLGLGNQ
jgi:hypothetical protein